MHFFLINLAETCTIPRTPLNVCFRYMRHLFFTSHLTAMAILRQDLGLQSHVTGDRNLKLGPGLLLLKSLSLIYFTSIIQKAHGTWCYVVKRGGENRTTQGKPPSLVWRPLPCHMPTLTEWQRVKESQDLRMCNHMSRIMRVFEKSEFSPVRKQRCRSMPLFSLHG